MPRRRPARSAPTPAAGPLRLSVTAATGAALATYLRGHIAAAHVILKPPLAELSIALVGDRRMAELHEQFLGVPGPTDVLTFPLEVDRQGRPLSGEVVVCVPEARRRGAAEGTGLKQEVLLYALHGLLHLCGFDDRTRSGFVAMHRTEDAILTALGIGPVFSVRGESRSKGNSLPQNPEGASGRKTPPGNTSSLPSPGVPRKGKRTAAARHAGRSSGTPAKGKPRAKPFKRGGFISKGHRSLSVGGARRASRRVD